jgi:hypothetical protein
MRGQGSGGGCVALCIHVRNARVSKLRGRPANDLAERAPEIGSRSRSPLSCAVTFGLGSWERVEHTANVTDSSGRAESKSAERVS